MQPWRLGTAMLDPPLLLAPMAGFTDAPMRWVSQHHGAAFAYTEMANAHAAGLLAPATLRILETLPDEGPVAAHLYGAEPDDFARAAERISELGQHASIDINCGCPVPRITQCGAGAALMASPALIGRIVAAAVAHTRLPVTVKTRLGLRPGEDVVAEVARIVADQGAAAIAIHGRYATQHHTGPVRHDRIADVVALGRLPVIGNGGVRSADDALTMWRRTGVDAVMVGWAAVGNPWVLQRIGRALRTGEVAPEDAVPLAELCAVLGDHLQLARSFKERLAERHPDATVRVAPEEGTVMDFRGHLFRYLNGLRGVSRLRGRLNTLQTLGDVQTAIDEAIAVEAEFRARVGRV